MASSDKSSKNEMDEKIQIVQEKIENACKKSGRKVEDVTLLAVSKFHSAQEIENAYNCGLRFFGENRVQEATEKFPSLLEKYPDMHLHLIGSLQRNKVKQIVPYVTCIQSVDRLELAQEIQKRVLANSFFVGDKSNGEKSSVDKGSVAQNSAKSSEKNFIPASPIDILFEFHTGEESKSGFTSKDDVFKTLDYILEIQKTDANGSKLIPKGFMTMAPFTDDICVVRKSFATLRDLAEETQKRYPMFDFSVLSMGMSGDFEIAIEEGSTMVRIGTAIFGERQYK